MTQPGPVDEEQKSPSRLSRRGFLVLGAGAMAAGGAVAAQWYNILGDNAASSAVTPAQAHDAAAEGTLLLIDIRRPDEWAGTGLGAGAVPLDMRRGDFEDALLQAAGGDRSRPVALICARGVRSRHMADRLRAAGFTRIIDVPEGMLGSGAGPGWLRQGLPVVGVN